MSYENCGSPALTDNAPSLRQFSALIEIAAIVRRMVHDDLTLQHPGSDTVRRLVVLLKESSK